ncbi:hypothetical protein BIZ83_gp101 [Erwinia phage vB_EamM_ChrisDB]|uniref:hypothetical protein n=1 Tax=Erwinia phage vB_EamM_ChrisDB TaxID=1883371 RepID=UPI00081D2628|nr:hypothetical protein BIZ83_gp101 [Erwinia phage vB_EamM_ChrisDB]ANZ48752.1 hypothetical protein CHRISDB_190 [Erwinia phage vB_EamM_ChrisDB]
MSTTAPAPFSGTLKLETYPNRYNTVVPPEGPFYRTGLQLTSTGTNPRPLTEGLDYYLCYYFKEAAEALKDQVFGGIMLITETSCNYTIYSVGREYRVPQSEIGKFLVKPDMKDPRNVDWSELMRYAPVVAPIDPPTSLEEAILRDDVVKALDDIRKGILERASELDDAYTEVTELIFANGKKIFDDNMYQHHMVKNAHQYTAEEVGALKVLTKAVDATKAFGKTIDELVDLMKRNGIQQTHIDTLMPVVLGELRGRLKVLSNGALTFRTSDSSHVITLQGDKFLITTTKPITITADADKNEPGIGIEVTSGLNAMYALSGAKAPIFNGAYLITPDMVSLYLSAVKLLPANAYFSSTDSVKIYGSAKDYSPVNMTAVVPTATTTTPGLLLVTSVSANISAGAAISQAAVTALKTTLDNYVDATYKVNNKGFVTNPSTGNQELTLLASDLGLGNVENTTPNEKPVTTAIRAVLNTKALSDHTHTFADLTGVPTASDTVAGLVQLWDAIDATTNKVATSKQGYNVQQKINTVKGVVNELLPAWTTAGSQFGNPGFLPIPTVGNFAGYQKCLDGDGRLGVVRKEAGTLYVLRNATDGIPGTDNIYYAYAEMTDGGALNNRQQTSVTYKPVGLATLAPGVRLVKILLPGDDGMVALGSDGRQYLILFNGTLNHAKHTAVSVFTPPQENIDGATRALVMDALTMQLVVYKDKVYLIKALLDNTRYCVAVWSGKPNEVFTNFPLTGGVGTNGDYTLLKATLTDRINQRDGTHYFTQAGWDFWTDGKNVQHGPHANRAGVVKNTQFRMGFCVSVWLANASGGQGFKRWPTSFTFDFESKAIAIDNPEIFPMVVDETGITFANGVKINDYNQDVKWPNGTANNRTYVSFNGDNLTVFWDTPETTSVAGCSTSKLPNGLDAFDFLSGKSKPGAPGVASWSFDQGRGSLYEMSMSSPVFVGSNSYLMSPVQANRAILVECDPNTRYDPAYGGFGPTNNRTAFDWNTYLKLTTMPYVCTAAINDGTLNGCYWDAAGSQNYQAVGSTPTSDTLNISSTEWNKLIGIVKSSPGSGAGNGFAFERINAADKLLISLFTFRPKASNAVWMVQAACMAVRNGKTLIDYYLFRVTPTVSATGDVSFPVSTVTRIWSTNDLDYTTTNISLTDFSGRGRRYGQSILCEGTDKKGILYIPNVLTVNQVGNTGALNLEIVYDASTSFVATVAHLRMHRTNYDPSYMVPLKDKLCLTSLNAIGPAFCAGSSASLAEWMASGMYVPSGAPVEILAGVKTAEGWNFYMTETTSWRIGAKYYSAAPYSVDLKSAFPGNYQNRIFYVHVALVNNVPQYQLLDTRQADTDNRLYLGTITTDSSRIIDTQLEKVKRMGGLKQMLEHAGTEYRHDVDRRTDQALSPIGLLRKEMLMQPATTPAYLDARYSNSVISPQKRSERRATIIKTPKVWAIGEPGNEAAKFFPKASGALATAAENSAAAAKGLMWTGINLGTIPENTYWWMRPLVTPTKSQIKVYIYLQAATSGDTTFQTNGVPIVVSPGNANSATFTVTPGQRMVVDMQSMIVPAMSLVLGSKWCAYAIYDFDGTTETLLASSGVDTPLSYSSVNAKIPNCVIDAETITLPTTTKNFWPVVSAGNCSCSPPVIVAEDATSMIVATKWVGLNGLETATDIAVNLMPRL